MKGFTETCRGAAATEPAFAIVSTLSRDETIDGFDWPKGETKWPVPIDIEIEMRRMPFCDFHCSSKSYSSLNRKGTFSDCEHCRRPSISLGKNHALIGPIPDLLSL